MVSPDTPDPLFQPLRLGGLELPNRVVMTTAKLGYGTIQGNCTGRHIAFYRRRARGGPALTTTEPMYVLSNGREIPTQLGIHDDALVPGYRRLTNAVHEAGGLLMAHINHAGRAANPRLVPETSRVSASAVLCRVNGVTPRALSLREIALVVNAFGRAASRVKEAGFDAVEVPFSHGYLIHQFLSPHSNRRVDEYGGTLENRLRFGAEVVAGVRSAVGERFPIVIRVNAADYVEGGLTVEDALRIAPMIEAMGVQALSVTSGTMCESVPFCLYPTGTPKANLLPASEKIKQVVSVPVIVAGRIRSPGTAREALAASQADLIGLARPFLADPDWVRKTAEHDEVAILLCAACHQGCLAELRKGHGTGCAFNPRTGHEGEPGPLPVDRPRQVMVIGGGPAGLEAALVAAQRGHRVDLYEKQPILGGQFHLAALPPHKEGFLDVIRYLELAARRAGVGIHCHTELDAAAVRSRRPDVVVLATGGIPLTVPFPGLEQVRWFRAADVLDELVAVKTQSALVVGGGLAGLETADFLAARGHQVTLLEMLPEVGAGMDPLAKAMIMKRLKQRDVAIHTATRLTQLSPGRAAVIHREQESELPLETLVIAVGVRPNRVLANALADSSLEVHVIGDAVEPRMASSAIREGFELACSL